MKTLSHIKWVVVILFGCLAVTLISTNCSPNPGQEVSRPGGSDSDGNDDRVRTRGTLKCELPSGNGSCEKDDDCVDWCEDDLDLSGDARDMCFDLDVDTVERLDELFNDVFDKPDGEKLDDLKDEDVELVCAAVKELDHELLEERLNYSSPSRPKYVLEWVAETKEAIEIFENAEKDEGLKMFKRLLSEAGGGSGTVDGEVLEGLTEDVDSDDTNTVLRIALDENNDRLVDYIHDNIIADEDELCSNTNLPKPQATCTAITNGGTDYASSGSDGYDDAASDYGEEACILGVYCKIASANNDSHNEFRKDMAEHLNSRNIANFIEEPIQDGGLGLTEDDAEDWTHKVCAQLKVSDCWLDSTSLDLDLTP